MLDHECQNAKMRNANRGKSKKVELSREVFPKHEKSKSRKVEKLKINLKSEHETRKVEKSKSRKVCHFFTFLLFAFRIASRRAVPLFDFSTVLLFYFELSLKALFHFSTFLLFYFSNLVALVYFSRFGGCSEKSKVT